MKRQDIPGRFPAALAYLHTRYQQADQLLGGSLSTLYQASASFTQAHAAQAAAAMAFFAFSSLFPLLLILVIISSNFLESEQVYTEVLLLITRGIPVSQQLIQNNLERLLSSRKTLGLLSIASLFWSASGVFNTLAYNINLAWPRHQRRNYVQNRLIALAIIGIFTILLGLSFVIDTIIKLLPDLSWLEMGINLREILYNSLPVLVIFLLLTGLYHWVPKNRVRWRAAMISALVSSLAWQLASFTLAWYLESGLINYSIVYGSLAAVVAMLLLIYILNWIVLFGAHLCAAIELRQPKSEMP